MKQNIEGRGKKAPFEEEIYRYVKNTLVVHTLLSFSFNVQLVFDTVDYYVKSVVKIYQYLFVDAKWIGYGSRNWVVKQEIRYRDLVSTAFKDAQ